jgi:DNA-binding transcriptional regulator YiaG
MSKLRMTTEEETFAAELGAWLQGARKTRKVSQEAIAEVCGCHRNTVWRWESGQLLPNLVEYAKLKAFFKNPRRPEGGVVVSV